MKRIILLSLTAIISFAALAQAPYQLPKLNYDYNALEPYIDAQTMRIHHTGHHQAYINNLNAALEKYPQYAKMDLETLISGINNLPGELQVAVRNNGGGHYNHSLFWTFLTPAGKSVEQGKVIDAIKRDFGSMEKFKEAFAKAATGRFGSGWAWLTTSPNGKLSIGSTPNQDSPTMDVSEYRGIPILGIDVWEHAYYLKYQSKRADYIKSFWEIVNWNKVNELYTKAIKE